MRLHSKTDAESYFRQGDTWDQEIFANMHQSRNRAWMLSFLAMGIALLSLLTLVLILPLKTFEPYVVTVDRNTGYLEVAKGITDGPLTQDDAITQSNLVRYISARESYNPAVLKENYDFVALLSSDKALSEFQQLWDGQNPKNPSIVYGKKAAIDIKIQSVSFLNNNTASVRFIRDLHENNQVRRSIWNAIIQFRYTQKPIKMLERFQNPLGFQVTSYRLNPEVMEQVK